MFAETCYGNNCLVAVNIFAFEFSLRVEKIQLDLYDYTF